MHVNLLVLENEPIYSQLEIEEALLRADADNWCVINTGSPPAIVMGISGKPEAFVDYAQYIKNPIPLIRRFSGGGTVVVDENTFFVSFIFSKKTLDFGTSAQEILRWTEALYKPIFAPQPFTCTENDYTIGEKKVGGNAHYFTKERWLHHTTFLWDYNPQLMSMLTVPEKIPDYRKKRRHVDFIDTLKNYYPTLSYIRAKLVEQLRAAFGISLASKELISSVLQRPYRKSLERVDWSESSKLY